MSKLIRSSVTPYLLTMLIGVALLILKYYIVGSVVLAISLIVIAMKFYYRYKNGQRLL